MMTSHIRPSGPLKKEGLIYYVMYHVVNFYCKSCCNLSLKMLQASVNVTICFKYVQISNVMSLVNCYFGELFYSMTTKFTMAAICTVSFGPLIIFVRHLFRITCLYKKCSPLSHIDPKRMLIVDLF